MTRIQPLPAMPVGPPSSAACMPVPACPWCPRGSCNVMSSPPGLKPTVSLNWRQWKTALSGTRKPLAIRLAMRLPGCCRNAWNRGACDHPAVFLIDLRDKLFQLAHLDDQMGSVSPEKTPMLHQQQANDLRALHSARRFGPSDFLLELRVKTLAVGGAQLTDHIAQLAH